VIIVSGDLLNKVTNSNEGCCHFLFFFLLLAKGLILKGGFINLNVSMLDSDGCSAAVFWTSEAQG
jgi:hypothetical protein